MSFKHVKIPQPFEMLFTQHSYRYLCFFGGRGSAKSWSIALFLLAIAAQKKVRILCSREIQKSIKDSVHKLLVDLIRKFNLEGYFTITKDSIISTTGSEFIFAGLHRNIDSIKSMEGIDYVWCEEAHGITNESLDILLPTIRKEGSQIIFSFNRKTESDPVYERFCKFDRADTYTRKVNYDENPFFPEVLEKEMLYDKEHNYEHYMHVWEGGIFKQGLVYKIEWFRYYNHLPEGKTRILQSWDTAYKDKQYNDPSCCTTWLEFEHKYYLMDMVNRRMQYPELKQNVQLYAEQYKPDIILIEDKASGQSLIQELSYSTNLPIIPIKPIGDKITRATNSTALIQAGKVFLPNNAMWKGEFEQQLAVFPEGTHDDIVDSTSQLLNYVKYGSQSASVEVW